MKPYFETMPGFGKELKDKVIARTQESRKQLEAVEADIAAKRATRMEAGIPAAEINKRGTLTVWQRLEYLVDKEAGARCTASTIRKTTRKAPPTSSTGSARSPAGGPRSSVSTTRCWRAPGFPDRPRTFCG